MGLIAGLLALAGPAAAREGDEGPGPLPWRVGGRLGFTADACAFPDSAGLSLEIYVRVPPGTLAALGRDSTGATRLRLSVRLRNAYGARQHDAVQEFPVARGDSSGGFGKVVMLRFPTRAGPQRVLVKLEDPNSRRRGIAYVGRQVAESSQVEGEVIVPGPQANRDFSDLEFAWHEGPAAGLSAFRRGDRAVIPNPERLYGLYETDLRVFFTARGPDERSWHWIARVLDPGGRLVAQQESTATASRWLNAATEIDMSHEPAGGYDLEVKAWQEGDPGALLRRSRFSVAWQRDSWTRNPRDVEDDVHFLLSADDEEAFADLHPGEQERYLEDFWKARDPSAGTAENEALRTFRERMDYANRTFGRTGMDKGMFSDMGRVYIRYGPASEVYKEVIPAGNETLEQVLRDLALTEDRPAGQITPSGPGGDIRPFEVWIYDRGEVGLPPDADPKVTPSQLPKRRLVFLFVDEHGLGDYRLRYSTE